MKKLLILLLPMLVIGTGCFNTTEDFTIRKDGSGVYGMKMDMGGMFELLEAMQAMAGEEADSAAAGANDALKELDKKMDTTIRFASFTDTATNLSAEEKALMKEATMHMVMNKEEKQFLIDMQFPFKKMSDLDRIMKLSQQNGGIMGKAMGNGAQAGIPGSPDFSSFFNFTFRDGLLEKKVDAEQHKKMTESAQFQQMEEMKSMMSEASMTTVIHLPRKVKKAEGPGVKLGADGQTVNIAASFTDILDNPNALTFRIEY